MTRSFGRAAAFFGVVALAVVSLAPIVAGRPQQTDAEIASQCEEDIDVLIADAQLRIGSLSGNVSGQILDLDPETSVATTMKIATAGMTKIEKDVIKTNAQGRSIVEKAVKRLEKQHADPALIENVELLYDEVLDEIGFGQSFMSIAQVYQALGVQLEVAGAGMSPPAIGVNGLRPGALPTAP